MYVDLCFMVSKGDNKRDFLLASVGDGSLPKWLYSFSVLVGCFGLNGPLRQYFRLFRVSQREREKVKEK